MYDYEVATTSASIGTSNDLGEALAIFSRAVQNYPGQCVELFSYRTGKVIASAPADRDEKASERIVQ